jgi:hypothetical protein
MMFQQPTLMCGANSREMERSIIINKKPIHTP